jgi:hypothetical protein
MDSALEYILSGRRFLWLGAGSPRACLTGGMGLGPGSMREARGADRW